MENLGFGLQLMIVGMTTVFLILLIVIYGGKLLIAAVNRIAPEEVAAAKKSIAAKSQSGSEVDAPTMAVLSEVVRQITGGKGRVDSVRKV